MWRRYYVEFASTDQCVQKMSAIPKNILRRKKICVSFLWMLSIFLYHFPLRAQNFNVSTDLLYWATSTPNVEIELRLAPRYSFSTSIGYNAFDFRNRIGANGVKVNPKLHHWLAVPEVKYWFCRVFERHYVSLQALFGKFNAGGVRFPVFLKDRRYEGWCAGAGLNYGYQWAAGKSLGVEASVGIGYVYMCYDKYVCGACGKNLGRFNRNYFGPTNISVSFIYYIR